MSKDFTGKEQAQMWSQPGQDRQHFLGVGLQEVSQEMEEAEREGLGLGLGGSPLPAPYRACWGKRLWHLGSFTL